MITRLKKLNLEELKIQSPKIFGDVTYDSTLEACKILFGPRCVTHNENSISVNAKVNLHLSLSWNETKIYIATYKQDDDDFRKGIVNWNLKNYLPRFFSLSSIVGYLELQAEISEYIEENEG